MFESEEVGPLCMKIDHPEGVKPNEKYVVNALAYCSNVTPWEDPPVANE
jgi:hypothetical protein